MNMMNNKTNINNSDKDKEELKEESFELNLPDVKDIPGQENIHPPDLREMADTTIASDDEEGISIFNDEETESIRLNREIIDEDTAGNLTDDDPETKIAEEPDDDFTEKENDDLLPLQEEALDQTGSDDDQNLRLAEVDDTDDDRETLNEANKRDDLDIPGADEDDDEEEIGEEDEENNDYSVADDE